jgi:F-type H+-transporting ATPase subunit b
MNFVVRVLLAVAVALPGAVAAAAEKHAAHAAPSLGSLVLPAINFGTFVALFWYFAWPLILTALTERRKLVEKEISDAEEANRAAAAMLTDIEARRAHLREEGERLLQELRAEADRERGRLLAAARENAERIRNDARLLGAQEGAQAARRIREEVAEQVIALVVGQLRQRLTRDDEERFASEFVSAVESGETR